MEGGPKGGGTNSGSAAGKKDFLGEVTDQQASIFCYVPLVGWIAAIVVLAAERFRNSLDVRFHAFQGLYLFVFWLFVDWVFDPFAHYAPPMKFLAGAGKIAVFGAWIFMIIKTVQGERFSLPLLGELAERSVAEQK